MPTKKEAEKLNTATSQSKLSDGLAAAVKDIKQGFYGDHDFVQTSPCGRGQHHPHGLVGKLWRICDPESVRVGNCFLDGRLKKGDLFLGVQHSGDCFQTYMFVEDCANCMIGKPEWSFGSYGIGNAEQVDLPEEAFELLKAGGRVEKPDWRKSG